MLKIPDALRDLTLIRPEHLSIFQAAAEDSKAKSYRYYFPRMLFNGSRSTRLLLFEFSEKSSLVLFSLHKLQSRLELRLYYPPFPFDSPALERAKERMRDFNNGRRCRIESVQEQDAPILERHSFSMEFRESEYIYDRAAVAELQGSQFSSLRKNLVVANRLGFTARRFVAADGPACLALYNKFCAQLSAKGIEPKGRRSMATHLSRGAQLPETCLRGEVFEVDGAIRGYSFGGPINRRVGCVNVAVADHELPGLAYAMRHRMLSDFPELSLFNDSIDSNRAGLRQMKLRFRPVELHQTYKARESGQKAAIGR